MEPLKAKIIKIGNSRGIRIPKYILELLNIQEEIELIVDEEAKELHIRSKKLSRAHWENAFKEMHKNEDDTLLIDSIYLVNLDPTIGHEIQKTRPCLVISPDEMNNNIKTIIIAPMTTKSRAYPTRVQTNLQGKDGWIVLDQIRTIDNTRIIRKLGEITSSQIMKVKSIIKEMLVD